MGIDDNDVQEQQQDDDGGNLQEMLGTSGETEFVVEGDARPPAGGKNLLVVVLLVALGAVVYFMYVKKGPASAAAGTVSAQDESAHKTITSFLSDSGQNIKVMQEMLKNTEKVVQQFNNYPSMTQVPVKDLQTNPFRFEESAAAAPAEDVAAKAKRDRDKARAEAIVAVQKLGLQSLMAGGSRRSCMINGNMYTEGQMVEGFLVEKITPAGVVLRKEPFRFQITMTP